MSNEITFTTIRNQLHDLDTQFKGSYTTPEALLALVKTIKSFNITITDWNTLINFINTTGSSVEGVYNFIPSIIDLVESEVNKLDNAKLEIASKVKRVDTLPEVGEPDTYYVVQDEDSATLHRVYFYNKWREEYVYLGSNAIDLGEYYTKTEGQQFEADLNAAFDNFYENAQEIIREKAEIYFASKEDKSNKVTTLSSDSTDTQYPSAKVVFDTIQYVIAIAEGKCKSYILSNNYPLSEASWSNYTVYDENGDVISTWTDFQTLVGARSLLNEQLKTQTAFSDSLSLSYVLTGEFPSFYFHRAENYFADAKTGDIVLVKELNVPDRWLEVGTSSMVTFYILETSKVDLTNYVTTNTDQEITGVKTINDTLIISNGTAKLTIKNNGWTSLIVQEGGMGLNLTGSGLVPTNNSIRDLGSSNYKWKDLYLSGSIYVSEINPTTGTDFTIGNTSGVINSRSTFRPAYDNGRNLGSQTLRWKDLYLSGNITDGTASFTVDSAYGTMFNYVNLTIGGASQLSYDELTAATYDSDTTISLVSAPDGCAPEYKGILSSGNSSVTLTFNGVSNILCNDDNCVVVNGTNSTITLPANTTIEVSILNGKMVAINWEV